MTVERRLKKLLVEELGDSVDIEEIRDDTSLYGKGLGLSSVDVMALIVQIEETFDVFFEDDEIAKSAKTFGTLAGTIRQKLGRR